MGKLDNITGKIMEPLQIQKACAVWRFLGKKIVFTNGCFDILHLGHIEYLSKAASLGGVLVVGLNTDDSVTRLKGSQRPINPQHGRAMVLASLSFVDAVVFFNEDTPYELIRLVSPDILVKGKDYSENEIVGSDLVLNAGGSVITIDLTPGYSTTSIAEKLRGTGK